MAAPLRLGGVPEHFNLPWHLAMESGALDTVPHTWEDQDGGTGQMLAGMESGDLDLVSILTDGTVAAIAGGLDVTILQVYVSSPLQWGVHVPAQSDIHDEAQLEGLPVAISRFTSGSHLMAFVQAERNGWSLDRSQFVVTGGLEGARASFASGESRNFLWDRYMTQALVDRGEFRRVAIQESPWPSFVIAVRNERLHGRTAEVGAVVDAVVDQATRLHNRPNVTELLLERYDLDLKTATAWLDSTTFAERGAVDQAMLHETLAQLRRAGVTEEQVADNQTATTGPA